MENNEKFLPIGSVVMLKEGKKRLMITGFVSIGKNEDNQKVYDYTGCIYPEGFLSSDKVCLFNHDQIEKVYFKGFVDDEEIKFKERLNEIIKKMDNNDQIDLL